jgi:ketosteroid isomerase-like protein
VSQENVAVVRAINEPYERQDIIPGMRVSLERLGPDPPSDALLEYWAEDPLLRHIHPDVEWEAPLPGVSTAHGAADVFRWWREWLEVWQSYTIRILEYRDLGDWVMTVNYIRARGRDGISLEITNFQLWQVRDGKVARVQIFFDEPAALEASGLEP